MPLLTDKKNSFTDVGFIDPQNATLAEIDAWFKSQSDAWGEYNPINTQTMDFWGNIGKVGGELSVGNEPLVYFGRLADDENVKAKGWENLSESEKRALITNFGNYAIEQENMDDRSAVAKIQSGPDSAIGKVIWEIGKAVITAGVNGQIGGPGAGVSPGINIGGEVVGNTAGGVGTVASGGGFSVPGLDIGGGSGTGLPGVPDIGGGDPEDPDDEEPVVSPETPKAPTDTQRYKDLVAAGVSPDKAEALVTGELSIEEYLSTGDTANRLAKLATLGDVALKNLGATPEQIAAIHPAAAEKPDEEHDPPYIPPTTTVPYPDVVVPPDPTEPPPEDDEVIVPPIILPPDAPPVEDPTQSEEPEDPPIILPPGQPPVEDPVISEPPPPTPTDVFEAAIGNMGAFHSASGSMSRSKYEPVGPPGEAVLPKFSHSIPVQQHLQNGIAPRASNSPQARRQGLGLVEDVLGLESPQSASSELDSFRPKRRGLGFG